MDQPDRFGLERIGFGKGTFHALTDVAFLYELVDLVAHGTKMKMICNGIV